MDQNLDCLFMLNIYSDFHRATFSWRPYMGSSLSSFKGHLSWPGKLKDLEWRVNPVHCRSKKFGLEIQLCHKYPLGLLQYHGSLLKLSSVFTITYKILEPALSVQPFILIHGTHFKLYNYWDHAAIKHIVFKLFIDHYRSRSPSVVIVPQSYLPI